MSTCNLEGVQDLTQDEQILHHHTAMIKKDLDAYRAHIRSKEDWVDIFTNHLACFILVIYFYMPISCLYRLNR